MPSGKTVPESSLPSQGIFAGMDSLPVKPRCAIPRASYTVRVQLSTPVGTGTKGAKFSFFKKEKISVELSPLEISIIASSMQPKCPVEGIGMVATRVEAKAINFEDLPDAIKAKIKETMEAQGKEQTGG